MANLCIAVFLSVIGIANAVPNEFSHYVDLKRAIGSTVYHHCSGVIVHPEWVLATSSAQCTARLKSIVAGDINEEVVEGTEQVAVPGEVIKHSTYPIALIKVSPAFQYNDHVNEAVFANEDVIVTGNTARVAGKNSATNDGYFQRIVQTTDVTLDAPEKCVFSPPPVGPGYSCLIGKGATRCAGERGSPVQCPIGGNNYFCGMVIDNGLCYKDGPNDMDPPSTIEEAAIHASVLKQWVSETIAART